MSQKLPGGKLPKSFSPAAEHRRQMIWQVWIPLAISILIVLAVAILAIAGTVQGSSQVNQWGNISAIYLLIPVLFVGLILFALTAGIAYGLGILNKKMPLWMFIVRMRFSQVYEIVHKGADTVVQPVMAVNSFDARVRAFWKKIFNKG